MSESVQDIEKKKMVEEILISLDNDDDDDDDVFLDEELSDKIAEKTAKLEASLNEEINTNLQNEVAVLNPLLEKEDFLKIKAIITEEKISGSVLSNKIESQKLESFDIFQIYELISKMLPHKLSSLLDDNGQLKYSRLELLDQILNLEKNHTHPSKKNCSYQLVLELFDTPETYLTGSNMKYYKKVLEHVLNNFTAQEINSYTPLFIKYNGMSIFISNVFQDYKNVWMLGSLISHGLDIHNVYDMPIGNYLHAVSYNYLHFKNYLTHLINLGVNLEVKDKEGDNLFALLIQEIVKVLKGNKELDNNLVAQEIFNILENAGVEHKFSNLKGQTIVHFMLDENVQLPNNVNPAGSYEHDDMNIYGALLINLINKDTLNETPRYNAKDMYGKTVMDILLTRSAKELYATLLNYKHIDLELGKKLTDDLCFFDKMMLREDIKEILLLFKEYYIVDKSNLEPENLEDKSYLYKSFVQWLHSVEDRYNHIRKIIELEPVVKEEEEIVAEVYTQENFNAFAKIINGLKNVENSKDFVTKKAKTPNSRYKTFAKSKPLLEKIESLRDQFPHFSEVIEHVENHCILQEKGNKTFYIPPMLLGGGPGIGKTFFSNTVAEIVGTYFHIFNMESMTANGTLTGTAEFWGTAAPGKIFNTLIEEKTINPIFILDELDKCLGDERYSPTNALLPLMERYTASKYKDECISIPIDASHIIWIATGNELSKISAPLKSRFDIFNVPNPSFAERKKMLSGVYKAILKNNSWGFALSNDLSDAVLDILADMNSPGAIRDLRRIITTACSRAVKENRSEIIIEDIGKYNKPEKMLWDMPISIND